MKTSNLDQFAADTITTPASVTGGAGLIPNLLGGLLGKTNVDLGVNLSHGVNVDAKANVGSAVKVDANVNLGGGSGSGGGSCNPHPSCH